MLGQGKMSALCTCLLSEGSPFFKHLGPCVYLCQIPLSSTSCICSCPRSLLSVLRWLLSSIMCTICCCSLKSVPLSYSISPFFVLQAQISFNHTSISPVHCLLSLSVNLMSLFSTSPFFACPVS